MCHVKVERTKDYLRQFICVSKTIDLRAILQLYLTKIRLSSKSSNLFITYNNYTTLQLQSKDSYVSVKLIAIAVIPSLFSYALLVWSVHNSLYKILSQAI